MLDQKNIFSDKQSLIHAVGTLLSTNAIDLGAPGKDPIGNTAPHDIGLTDFAIECRVTDDILAAAGAATVQVQLCAYDDAGRTLNRTVLYETAAIPKATLVKGYRFQTKGVPPGTKQQVLSVEYVIATNPVTAGTISAYIAHNAAA